MAAEGSEQQRLKTALDVSAERLSIERDLAKVARERLDTAEDAEGVEKKSLALLHRRAQAIDQLGKRQIGIEREILLATEKIKTETNIAAKESFEASVKTLENEMRNLDIRERMLKALFADSKLQVEREKQERAAQQLRLEKVQDYVGKLGEIFKLQAKNYKFLKDAGLAESSHLVMASAFAAIIEYTVTKFLEFDKALAKFRVEMGLLRSDSFRVAQNAKDIAVEFANIGVTMEGTVVATAKLADEFGGTMKISKDLVETTSILKAQLGVSEEASAGFLRNIAGISKSTAQAQRHMTYVASALSAAAGVPLNMVMTDVSKMSGNALALVSRMPSQIVKTAVAARELGTTLNKMADASSHLLNFTENVQAEMEASVLVGQAINLQKARELAYHRNIEGSTREILKIAKQIDFQNLDYFQMNAFAAATGRSVDELTKMIQAQKQLEEARGIDGLKDEVAVYDQLKGAREAELKDAGLQREMQVKMMANQERIAALTQQWNKLLLTATAQLFPIIDFTMRIAGALLLIGPPIAFVTQGFERIGNLVGGIGMALNTASKALVAFGKPLVWIGTAFVRMSDFFTGILGFVGKLSGITKIFGFLGTVFKGLTFLAPFTKAIPVIGWIITGLQFVYNLFKHIKEEGFTFGAVWHAVYDTLIKPFVDAWDWIKGIFVGHSPSTLALGIVRGIIGAQTMVFDALTSPFRKFLGWIADKIPFLGKTVGDKIRGGMTGALRDTGILEKKVGTPEIKPIAIATEATPVEKITAAPEPASVTAQQKDQDSATLAEILKAVNVLNSNLLSGKIGVYMDGQLLSSTLARQTAFRGGYGTNNVV